MTHLKKVLIFCYGLFTISSQTLLFREFLTSFEGNDIGVGIFFASWFLWVGLGALLVSKARRVSDRLLGNIEFLFLAYVPIFVLQAALIIHIRDISGLEHFVTLPVVTTSLLAVLVNAPVSFITGLLFPLLCRWIKQEEEGAVSGVYILEAAGSFLGGLGVTVLLALGVSSIDLYLWLALIVSLPVAALEFFRAIGLRRAEGGREAKNTPVTVLVLRNILAWAIPVIILVFVTNGLDRKTAESIQRAKWSRLLPADAFEGSFQTAQAEYLYGRYRGQVVTVRDGGVVEAYPDDETNGRIAAIVLCQRPEAESVLVIGSGLGLCREFLKLKQAETVCWAHCDNEYIGNIRRLLPAEFDIADKRFHTPEGDIRAYLAARPQMFDMVILNLPETTSSALNRYYTIEFYQMVKKALRRDGLLAVRITSGENIIGTELADLGASAKETIAKVFAKMVLTPGQESWFLAADAGVIDQPAVCRERFAAIEGAENIFAADGLLSVYLPERSATAIAAYEDTDLPEKLLVNSDSRPLTYLYSLLLSAKESGAPVTRFIKLVAMAGPLPFFIPIIVVVAIRLIYVLKAGSVRKQAAGLSETGGAIAGSFDSSFLIFTAGFSGIGAVIILMYLYQMRFGQLYLHIGVISSVFMLGLTIGAKIIRNILAEKTGESPEHLILLVIFFHVAVLLAAAFGLAGQVGEMTVAEGALLEPGHLVFGILFILCGFCAGCYFPLAAGQLAGGGFETGQAAARLEAGDHFGACAGGFLTGILLVPVLGITEAVVVLIVLIAANVPTAVVRIWRPASFYGGQKAIPVLRRAGLCLLAAGLIVVICSETIVRISRPLSHYEKIFQQTAADLAGDPRIKRQIVDLDDTKYQYFSVYDSNSNLAGYVFDTARFAGNVRGYGGRIDIAVYTDAGGRLVDFRVMRSNETPEYLELVTGKRSIFKGRDVFGANPFAGLDAVTGATISFNAVTASIEQSGQQFAEKVLKKSVGSKEAAMQVRQKRWDFIGIYLAGSFLASLVVIFRGSYRSRLIFLAINVIAAGMIFNVQYSTDQVTSILSLSLPAAGVTAAFLLIVCIPIVVLVFGNIYCGYLCPFGALQELAGELIGDKLKPKLHQDVMKRAAYVKYFVLFVFITAFFVSRSHSTLSSDPLITVFSDRAGKFLLLLAVILTIGAVFYRRFWCRYLCPAGAFLSLLNRIAILQRYLPVKRFGRCDFGIAAQERWECIYCDRCRYACEAEEAIEASGVEAGTSPAKTARQGRVSAGIFGSVVLLIAIIMSAVTVDNLLKTIPKSFVQTKVVVSATGQPRKVDAGKIKQLIQEKKLSDKEAEFYKKAD